MPSMLKQIEKGIICLGQAKMLLKYYRRLPIVTKIIDSEKKAQKVFTQNDRQDVAWKQILKNHTEDGNIVIMET